MWLENLKDARIRAGNPTFKEIAQKAPAEHTTHRKHHSQNGCNTH
jgi:hypothetical protein